MRAMSLPRLLSLSGFAQDWGALITTVVLAAITAWYAVLTKRLADSAEESADSARRAAEASQAAVVIAESSVEVQFTLGPMYSTGRSEDPESAGWMALSGVTLHSGAATVYVHSLRLDRVVVPTSDHGGFWQEFGEELIGTLDQFGRDDPATVLPQRLHKGEMMYFLRADPTADDPESVSELVATVMYSLDGSGAPRPLRIAWHGKPGRDFHAVPGASAKRKPLT